MITLKGDLWAGLVLGGVGLWALWEASSFDERSGTYPTILAALLAVSGFGLAVTSLIKNAEPIPISGPVFAALPAAGVVALWAVALGLGLGVLLPTLFMQIALMWLGGVRGLLRIVGYAVLITGAAYGLFALVLDVPLPQSRIPGLI